MNKSSKMSLLVMGWLLLFEVPTIHAQITGVWFFKQKGTKIEFYKMGNIYCGRIVNLVEPINKETWEPFTDTNNPNVHKRTQPLICNQLITRHYDTLFCGPN